MDPLGFALENFDPIGRWHDLDGELPIHNRNWEEVLHVPVGPDNRIEPDGPDRGQPTVFVPRRRFGRAVERRETMVFSVRVPSDWTSEDEVVWRVTANGRTDRASGLPANLRTAGAGKPRVPDDCLV